MLNKLFLLISIFFIASCESFYRDMSYQGKYVAEENFYVTANNDLEDFVNSQDIILNLLVGEEEK